MRATQKIHTQKELVPDNTWESYATKHGYEIYLRRWILPQWGTHRLGTIKPVDVEAWLRQLPLARGSCAKIRNIMSVLSITHADTISSTAIRSNLYVRVGNGARLHVFCGITKSGSS
jgi:hypothetical protein